MVLIAAWQQARPVHGQFPPAPPFAPPPQPPAASPPAQYNPAFGPQQPRYPGGRPPFRQARSQPRQSPPLNLFQPAQKVAEVGNHVILAGDLLGPINQALEPYLGRVSDEELAQQRQVLMRTMLPSLIETKLVYLDFLRQPMISENLPQIQKQLFDQFEEKQLPRVMKKAGVATPRDLDAKLRSYGSSLYKSKLAFVEQVLAQQMVQQTIDMQPTIAPREKRQYYQEHIDDYSTPAKARWEHLMIRFDKMPNRNAAYRALGEMGNEVLGGAPLAAVARAKSHGSTADRGGYHDWTVQGSLVSKPLDYYIFTLPVGKLSQRFADEKGLHIVRVMERHQAAVVPFKTPDGVRIADTRVTPDQSNPDQTLVVCRIENSTAANVPVEATVYVVGEPFKFEKTVVPSFGSVEVRFELEGVDPEVLKQDAVEVDIEAQARIGAMIRKQKMEEQRQEYLARLRERTPVWTVFGNLEPPQPR